MGNNGHKDMHVFMATQHMKWQGFQGDGAKYWDLFLFIYLSKVAMQLALIQGSELFQKNP